MNAICVFLLVYLIVTVECWCPKQDTLNTEERKCKKSCENHADCEATNKECVCDGECGMSCFNPSAECLEPEQIPNGSYKTNTLVMQGKAIYSCNEGYVLIGNNKRICRADKKWHGAVPACKKGCLDPPQVGNAYPNIAKHTFEIDEEVTYLCRTGYYIEDRTIARRTCKLDGAWTVPNFHCNLQICDELYSIPNGKITTNRDKNYFGTTATLHCNPGYDSFPRGANRRCFAGSVDNSRYGIWTGSFPSCNIKSCPSPKDPAHGEVVGRTWVVLEFGNKISYKCDVGYKIEGESSGQCDDLGTWGIMPNCKLDPNCDFNKYSSSSCGYTNYQNEWDRYGTTENNGFPGYVIRARYEGSKLISPEIAADWSSSQFICLKFDYYLHPIGSLAIESTRDFDDSSISWNTNENEISNTWLDAILNIETTRSIKYQFIAKNPTVYLDNVQVHKEKCVEHCSLIPCKNSGSCVNRMQTYTCFCTIDFEGPTCDTDIKCPKLHSTIPNGNLAGTRPLTQNLLLPDSTASYTCKPKYKMTGFSSVENSKSTRCYRRNSRSYWEPDPSYQIKCIPITCKNPEFQSNQHALGEKTSWRVDETVEIECDKGYAFKASNPQTTITCGNDERWLGTITTCYDIKCINPTNFITNGKRTNKSWHWFPTPRDTARYECDDNYKMYGLPGIQKGRTITCIGSSWFRRSWWSPYPSKIQCVDIECAPPVFSLHQTLVQNASKWKVNSVATYRCDHGYEFSNGPVTRTITCRENEKWTVAEGNNECIEDIKCPSPPSSSNNGKYTFPNTSPFYPNAMAEYRCDDNYKLFGKGYNQKYVSVKCLERDDPEIGSDWFPSLDLFGCEAITCKNSQFKSNQHAVGEKTSWKVDETVEIECDDGYAFEALNPQTTFTCGNDERWLGTITACYDIKCINLTKVITNGKRTDESWYGFPIPRDTAGYECHDNYKMYGLEGIQKRRNITCRGSSWFRRSWWSPDPSDIRCVDIECAPPVLRLHQTLDNHARKWKVNSVATYRCDHGYEFSSGAATKTITCRSNEEWTVADGNNNCIEDIECSSLPSSSNHGNYTTSDNSPYYPDTTAEYSCDYNYKLIGESYDQKYVSLKCVKRKHPEIGSEWFPNIDFGCEAIKCTIPEVGRHQRVVTIKKLWQVGDTVDIECKNEYDFASSQPQTRFTCGNNETWHGNITECYDTKCHDPPPFISHGELKRKKKSSPATPGNTRKYKCYRNYEMNGLRKRILTVTCKESESFKPSAWDPNPNKIQCVEVECTPPKSRSHQRLVNKLSIWKVNSVAIYRCDHGYNFSSGKKKRKIRCQIDGVWSSAGDNRECIENKCLSNPCQNGECMNKDGSFVCDCFGGFTGKLCETDINECISSSCQNAATCIDGLNDFTCLCVPGYTGITCDIDIDDCQLDRCENGAECKDEFNDFACLCLPGYTGKTCNTVVGEDVDHCDPNLCQNKGICEDDKNDFFCECVPGYRGKTCDEDINDCEPDPCQNGAKCIDKVNDFGCTCVPGYTGKTCDTDIDHCDPNPCQHAVRCENILNVFFCFCISGYAGTRCDKEIDECSSDLCKNGGTCTDELNGYSCSCITGFTGNNCETNTPCASPSLMENGDWNDQHVKMFYKVDEKLWFTCDKEYVHTGSDSAITCLSSGEWSLALCRPIKK